MRDAGGGGESSFGACRGGERTRETGGGSESLKKSTGEQGEKRKKV